MSAVAKATILLVEDDRDIQENLRMFLESEGYGVVSAFNGKEALQRLAESAAPGGPRIDLILLDLMMPVMNGHEFLDATSGPSAPALPGPTILLSAGAELEQVARKRGLQYVSKPINLEKLLSKIESRGAKGP